MRPGEALLAFGADVPVTAGPTLNLSVNGDLIEAAAGLFAALRELDRTGTNAIAVMPIPERGIGEAINDRLRRAAALVACLRRPLRSTGRRAVHPALLPVDVHRIGSCWRKT